jgi:2-polyprenyl-3-methyl-5-hydroxy-6-metoxy-1,4-benzoquinol methylase
MEQLNQCPSCEHPHFSHFLAAKDHTVSHDTFEIVQCAACQLLFTNPRPEAKEAGKYYQSENYISHSNTQKGLINQLYHYVRNITLRQKTSWIEKYKQGEKMLLDIGCGNGHFLHAAKNKDWKVTGMELDSETAKRASELVEQIIYPSLKEIPDENQFNVISMWHVLEHVYELEDYFLFFKQHLLPTGQLLLALPNHLSHDAQIYQEHWAAYDVPRHIYHFNPQSLETLAQKHGFKIVKSKGQVFDSFYISLLSNEYKFGKKRVFFAFYLGMVSNLIAYFKSGNYSSNLYILEHA